MKPKTLNILYWSFTIFFALLMLMDGAAGFANTADGQAAMRQLGYPNYIMNIVGVGKILAAIAIVQNKFITIKEWAYAGLTINFVGASASWALSGGQPMFVIIPLIGLAVMFVPYFLWKKRQAAQAAGGALTSSRASASSFQPAHS